MTMIPKGLRGTGKTESIMIYDEYQRMVEGTVSHTLQSFKENPNERVGFFIKRCGEAIPLVVPPHTGLVILLRLLFAEHGGGKMYLQRTLSVTSKLTNQSDWVMFMWGGGRTKVKCIKEVDVRKDKVPKVLQLLDMLG